MKKTIKAIFLNGLIEPLEKLDFEEGKELEIVIIKKPAKEEDSFLKAAGSWKDLIDAEELIKNIYADRQISTRPEMNL